MKNIFKLSFALILGISFLAGCNNGELSLQPPINVQLAERTVSWNEVDNATGYNVKIDEGVPYEVGVNSFTLPRVYRGPLTISVQATAEDIASLFSAPISVTAYLTLETPENLRQDGDQVLWDEVEDASSYVIKINDAEFPSVTNSYSINPNDAASIQVLAVGNVSNYIYSSPYSSPLLIQLLLATPTNIVFTNGVITWNAVSNAASYIIIINDDEYTSSTNSYTAGYNYVGSVTVQVIAVSSDPTYSNSLPGTVTLTIAAIILSAPNNLILTGSLLTFDAVEYATGYELYFNGDLIDTVTTNQYTVPTSVLETEGGYLQVKAISVVHTSSSLSEKLYLGTALIEDELQLRSILNAGAYTLANDIALTEPWIPHDFEGFFNGGDFTISGIEITVLNENGGFFASLTEATITNLRLVGTINITSNIAGADIGGLVGTLADSNVSSVTAEMDISVNSTNGIAHVGGLIGTLSNSNVTDCHYLGDIDTTNAITGGLIGRAINPKQATEVTQSSATSLINSIGGEQAPVGGFIGLFTNNNLTISTSKAEVSLTGFVYVGGFVGYMGTGHINNCYAYGSLSALGTSLVQAGGFIGRTEGYNNSVSFAIARMEIDVENTGDYISVGSFVGVTPGGSYANIYSNCYYSTTLSTLDRVGNAPVGRGDGITGVSDAQLLLLSQFDSQVWVFSGDVPRLYWE